MSFAELITCMTQAACLGDGAAVAACFTADGRYHDVFYGTFQGAEIVDLIEGRFHRDGGDFRWDLHEPVATGGIGYVRYVFSYVSRLEGHAGRRACFEGVAICRLKDGLIQEYREVANAATGLSLMGFPEARVARFVAREARDLLAREEAAAHRG
ncbi:MAG: nuclear transport factor 2 family protein [Pseudomonadota bacterium]